MASLYDDFDLRFTWNGDFLVSNGDFDASLDDPLQSLKDQIHSICASIFDDWETTPNRAADLDDFIGEPNIPTTAAALSDRIRIALVSNNVVEADDLKIKVMPVHIHRVLVIIQIDAVPSVYNGLSENEPLVISLVYDSVEKQAFFLDTKPDFF